MLRVFLFELVTDFEMIVNSVHSFPDKYTRTHSPCSLDKIFISLRLAPFPEYTQTYTNTHSELHTYTLYLMRYNLRCHVPFFYRSFCFSTVRFLKILCFLLFCSLCCTHAYKDRERQLLTHTLATARFEVG